MIDRRSLVCLGFSVFFVNCSSPRVKVASEQQKLFVSPRSITNSDHLSEPAINALRDANIFTIAAKAMPVGTAARLKNAFAQAPNDLARRQAFAEVCIEAARRVSKEPETALGFYLQAARAALPAITGEALPTQDAILLGVYNHATGMIAATLAEQLTRSAQPPQTFAAKALDENFTLQLAQDGPDLFPSGYFDELQRAETLKTSGMDERVIQSGVGAALVGTQFPTEERLAKIPNFPFGGRFLPATAIIRFESPHRAVLSLHDVLGEDHLVINKRRLTLAADFSAPLGLGIDHDPNRSGFLAALRPGNFENYMSLTAQEPFRPHKLPVIFIHGLASNGATWDKTLNHLMEDPVIREHFQFWLYQYPSGLPFIYPASDLRRELRETRLRLDPKDRLPALDHITLIGHSMGGLVTSAQIRRTDETSWKRFFTKPLDQMDLDPKQRESIRELLYMKPAPYIDRAIFVAVPHRGSTLADSWVGRLSASLIKLPSNLITLDVSSIFKDVTDAGLSVFDVAANSVTRLRYYDPALSELVRLPIDPRIHYHSIVGDRGVGNAPNSSDGVVSYASSHLNGAESEKIVPAWHSVHRHPAAIEEIRRILHLQLAAAHQR